MESNTPQTSAPNQAPVSPTSSAKAPKMVVTPAIIAVQGIVMVLLSMGILWVADHFFHGHHLSALFAALVPTVAAFKLGLLLAVPFTITFELSWVLRYKLGFLGENTENFLKKTTPGGFAVISLDSGFSEEVLFRGALQAFLGVWGTSALFGLVHCTGKKSVPYVINTFIMGLCLGLLFVWSGSLWAGIVVHMVNNFLCCRFAPRFRALFGCKVESSGETLAD